MQTKLDSSIELNVFFEQIVKATARTVSPDVMATILREARTHLPTNVSTHNWANVSIALELLCKQTKSP